MPEEELPKEGLSKYLAEESSSKLHETLNHELAALKAQVDRLEARLDTLEKRHG